ncbi:MAG TPA: MFS transporter, partial [Thermomicrobiales bacterium]|nr:MFS transporter [Thermomicrobiales bacterium]
MPRTGRSIPPQIALVLLYAASGLIWGTWIAQIPSITNDLELTRSQIGLVLPSFPVGALLSFPVVAIISARVGSGRTTMAFGLLRAAVFPLLGLAPDMETLMLALGISGFAHGGLEVSLNTQGVEIEHQTTKPILARGAAASSIGTLLGALGVWLHSHTELPRDVPFLIPAIIGVVMFWYLGRHLLPEESLLPSSASPAHQEPSRWKHWFPPSVLWVLLGFAFITELADEAISEWVSIYLEDDLETGPAITSLNYSIYTIALLVGRLSGDTIARHVPPVLILQAGGIIGGIGVMVGVGFGTSTAVLIGTGITGLGTSLLLPTIYRLAGSTSGI